MAEKIDDLGKKLYDDAKSQRLDAVKKIIAISQRNPRVLDWKTEEVK